MRESGQGRSVEELAGLFGYSRQNYYQQQKRQEKRRAKEKRVLHFVREVREIQPRIGVLKLQHLWNESHRLDHIGRDGLYELLGRYGLLIRKRKRYRPKQTDGNGQSIYPDLRKGLELARPNHLWSSDITYIEVQNQKRFVYLTCFTDEYSHYVVGYHLSYRMRTQEVLKALKMAVNKQSPKTREEDLIIHSDRGGQFKAQDYIDYTDGLNIARSMAGAGKSHENPVAERLNGILKNELLVQDSFQNLKQARQAIHAAIEIYNHQRPHLSCQLKTPQEAHHGQGVLKKLWRQRKRSSERFSKALEKRSETVNS